MARGAQGIPYGGGAAASLFWTGQRQPKRFCLPVLEQNIIALLMLDHIFSQCTSVYIKRLEDFAQLIDSLSIMTQTEKKWSDKNIATAIAVLLVVMKELLVLAVIKTIQRK